MTTGCQVWGKLVSLNEDSYASIILNQSEIWFGRDQSCHKSCQFKEATISKKHCRLFSNVKETGEIEAHLTDCSANGTFVNDQLIGKGNTAILKDGCIISLLVPGPNHSNFNKMTPAYQFYSSNATHDISEQQLEELQRININLLNKSEKWLKAIEEYREANMIVNQKAHQLIEILKEDNSNNINSSSNNNSNNNNSNSRRFHNVLARIEDMKASLNLKNQQFLFESINNLRENDLQIASELEKSLKLTRKEYESLSEKLKKEKDPFKEKQIETKFNEIAKQFELQNLTYVSKLKEIEAKSNTNISNWLIRMLFNNLDFFKTGLQSLQSVENEMRQKDKELSSNIQAQEQLNQRKIDRLKQLQESDRTNSRLKREKQGYLFKNKKPLWFVLMDGNLSYFKSWREMSPIGTINLLLASVRMSQESKKKLTFELTSPAESLVLQAQSTEDFEEWMTVFKNAIAFQLEAHRKNYQGEKTVSLDNITSASPLAAIIAASPSNSLCADCNLKDPDWTSINLGCIICHECSGVHRALGTHISKVRSLTLDKWEPQLLQIMKLLGNQCVNSIFEASIPSKYASLKLDSNLSSSSTSTSTTTANSSSSSSSLAADRTRREKFIKAKYLRKKFIIRNANSSNSSEISRQLYQLISSSDDETQLVQGTVKFLAQGANINWPNADENNTNVLHYAVAAGNLIIVELLIQNGANLSAVDSKGWTPLHYAASNDRTGCARLLLNRGAAIDIRDSNGSTPFDVANLSNSVNVRTILQVS
eukprot:TRINITY_DN468_c0_g1_i1.p1 TRINITY_DN468_c0_g1~~TRINITY_DN468_c0_g1_i1.p1  ORF type:complete len:765 (-),score=408.14 TRINITY_DN468_c0_g1_i1:202-2496(-)